MKRSELDRFIADRSGHEQDMSADVHLIVTEGRRGVATSWRYLAVATVIVAAAAAILVASLIPGARPGRSSVAATSARRSVQSTPPQPVASIPGSSYVETSGYGGLG